MKLLDGHLAGDRTLAVEILRSGGLVGIPTETVYGLSADARNEESVRRIFSVKGRPLIDPLITHCASVDKAQLYCEFNEIASALAEAFWPGPLTLVLPRRKDCEIPSIVSAGLASLAVRVPSQPILKRILDESDLPLAAPSANPFGYISPTRASHVIDSLGQKIDAILDGGPCKHGVESTILAVDELDGLRLLRPGPISREEIETQTGLIVEYERKESVAIEAPGMLSSHYRPRKGIRLINKGETARSDTKEAIVYLQRPTRGPTTHSEFWLSENGDPEEIASNLFDLLRKLDTDFRYNRIAVEYPSESSGVLTAVRDRLGRAATEPS